MADEDNDQAGDDLSAVEIPDLKKKQEKERKKAGAAWSSGKPAGSWQGAVGGNGAAGARGAMGAAGNLGGNAAGGLGNLAGGAGRGFFGALRGLFQGGGGIGGFLSRAGSMISNAMRALTATMAGKMAVAAAVAVAVGLAAILAARLLGGGGAAGGPDLAGLKSGIQIDRGGKSGLDYARSGGTGLAQPVAAKPAEAPKTETAQTAQEAPPAEDGGGDGMGVQEGVGSTGPADRMAHDLSGSKLSSGLGGNFQNTPFANVSAPKFPGLSGKPTGFGKGDGRKGVGGRLMSRNVNANRNMNLRGLRSSRALGQLRGMGSQVGSIMQKAGETSSAEATTQFEGTANQGGTAPTGPTTGPTGVEGGGGTNPGGTGPGITEPTAGPDTCTLMGGTWDAVNKVCTPPTVAYVKTTPWQPLVEEGKSKLESIKNLLDEIAMLWVLVAILIPLTFLPFCSGGACAIAALAVTMYKIYEKCRKVHDLGSDLIRMGDQINGMDGGKPQGDIFKDFGEEAHTAAIVAGTVPIFGALMYGQILDSAIQTVNGVNEGLKAQNEAAAEANAQIDQQNAEWQENYNNATNGNPP